MRNSEWRKLASVVGRILLAFLFVFSQSAWAAQDPKAKDNPKPVEKTAIQQSGEKGSPAATTGKTQTEEGQAENSEKSSAEEMPTDNGSHEGIKVHGHWTIDVRDPDGTLVTHREFENSLQRDGAFFLAGCLANGCSKQNWSIRLSVSTAAICASQPTASNLHWCYYAVTPSLVSTGAGSTSVVMSVTLTAEGGGSAINGVDTTIGSQFTGTGISSSMSIAAQQIVQVTVAISFS
jgi:hypothetical protein